MSWYGPFVPRRSWPSICSRKLGGWAFGEYFHVVVGIGRSYTAVGTVVPSRVNMNKNSKMSLARQFPPTILKIGLADK